MNLTVMYFTVEHSFLCDKKEYYTLARRFEFYVLVARTISHSCHSNIKFIPSRHRVITSMFIVYLTIRPVARKDCGSIAFASWAIDPWPLRAKGLIVLESLN